MTPSKPSMIAAAAILGLSAAAVSIPLISEVIKPQPILTVPYESLEINQKQAYIRVSKTQDVVLPTKDPIWKVELVLNNQVMDSVEALIGRSYRQTSNRHTAGNKSPLPQGRYSIDSQGISKAPFDDPELGSGYWIPINPLFSTGRSALGIHQDPSWGITNGESGTSGCIGLRSSEDTAKVVDWVRKYNPQSIVVVS